MKIRLFIPSVCILFAGAASVKAQQCDSLKSINVDEVTVSAFRVKSDIKQMPLNVQVLQKKDIHGVPNESVSDLLKKLSAVDIVEYPGFSASIGMRGFSPTAHGSTYTLLLVNGIPAGTQNPSTIDLNVAEQVEILRGPYSSFFGSGAMAGVVNIVTPMSSDQLHGAVGLSAGSFGTVGSKAQVGGRIIGKLNFDLSVKWVKQYDDYKTGTHNLLNMSDAEKQLMDDKSYGNTFKNTQYGKYNANFRVGYHLSDKWQINLYQDVFVADHILSNGNFWGTYGSNEKGLTRWGQSLSITGLEGIHSIKFAPYMSNEDVKYYNNISDTSYVTSRNNFKTYGFVLQDAIKFGNHTLIAGIDNYSQKYVNQQWSNRLNRTTPYQPDYANIANGAFVQGRFNFFDNKLTAAVGARFDLMYFKVFDTDYIKTAKSTEAYRTLNPNLGLHYTLLPGLTVGATAGTAFLAPDAFKKTGSYSYATKYGNKVYVANPGLKPEKSQSYDVSISYVNSLKGIHAGVTYFDNTHKGLMVNDKSRPDTTSFKNADNASMQGVEVAFAYDLGSLADYRYSLKLYTNFTHLLKADVTLNNVTSRMKYVRKNNASFGVEFKSPTSLMARINGRFIGHRLEDNWLYGYDSKAKKNVPLQTTDGQPIRPGLESVSVPEHPDFMVFDATCSYTFVKKYGVAISVQNLLDENYTEKDGYYMSGRMVTISFSYSF